MKKEGIKKILEEIGKVKIAVYGDFCLDAYWQMDPDGSEVSVETGLKAEAVARHWYTPGGAANIVANLAALQPGTIRVIGVVGDDIHGRELIAQLKNLGADVNSLIVQQNEFDTYTYTKKYYEDKEEPRIDFGLKNRRSEQTDAFLLENIESALQNFDALIFNQQVSGSITNRDFIDRANDLFDSYADKIVVLDSRHFNAEFRNVYRKANETEIAALNGHHIGPQDFISVSDIKKHGIRVHNKDRKPVFVTCGNRGLICFHANVITEIPGIMLTGKLDTVGAGDTTISALTLCLAAGISPAESAEFANLAAAVTVQKLFTTGTASAEEILRLNSTAIYLHHPELAANPELAEHLPGTDIELVNRNIRGKTADIKHALFDHDGTISTLRQGWEAIMEPVMIKAIMGQHFDKAPEEIHRKIREEVRSFIDRTTGEQTILQMEELVQMVLEARLVPGEEILDKFGYKRLYNEALMEMVSRRLQELEKGSRKAEDYTISGAIDFLKSLKGKGVRLYLASGTDIQDVQHEARILGYADLFDGGIHGSVNDVRKYSKKMVVKQILKEHNLREHELAVFGDGPVEIRESKNRGGISVGVASDEIRRSGLNPEKRSRLIRAGADLVVPDFSEGEKLLHLLFSK